MKLFLDNLPMGDIPGPSRKPGEFFPRLVGFRVSVPGHYARFPALDTFAGEGCDGNAWASIDPIYIPVIRVHQNAGQMVIEINHDRPLAYITIQMRQPFVNIFIFPWRQWDQEEP